MTHMSQFPNCCAIGVHCSFGETSFEIDEARLYLQKQDKQFEKRWGAPAGMWKDDWYYPGDPWTGESIAMIVINHKQYKIYNEMLKEFGYKLVAGPMYHKSHRSEIYVYIKNYWKKPKQNAKRKNVQSNRGSLSKELSAVG